MESNLKLLVLTFYIIVFSLSACQSQPQSLVGGPCEGCEAIFEYGDKNLSSVDTLPDFGINEAQMKITGTVYHKDGKTPASGVIIYIYHTNSSGEYPKRGNETGWAQRHGYIRGWTKTNSDGKYTFYTFRPAAYPNAKEPAHIHITIKEPDKNEYYLDDYLFDDDPLLTPAVRSRSRNRGGSGIVNIKEQADILLVHRDIFLGRNIPNYN